MSESMFEIEHKPGEMLTIRVRPPKMRHLAPEAKEHVRAARKEFLLGIRSVIDKAIEMTEEHEAHAEKHAAKGKRTKIDVQ